MTLAVKDIAERYKVTEHTVLGWIESGELKAFNVGRTPGKEKPRWRVTEAALAAFETLRTPTPPQPKARRRKRQTNVIEFY